MKKFIAPLIVVLILLGIYLFNQKSDLITYRLEGKNYKLVVADEEGEWERGLMNISTLGNADGMIFLFPDRQYRSFWNKETHLNLDIYWLDNNEVVGKSFLPAIEKSRTVFTVKSPAPVNKVIEIVNNQ